MMETWTHGSFYFGNIMQCNFQKSSCYFLAINLLLGLNVYIYWSSSILNKKILKSFWWFLSLGNHTNCFVAVYSLHCRIEMRGTGNESRLFLSWPLVRKFQWSPCIPRECPSPTHASRAHQTTPRYPYCRQGRKSFSNGCFLKQQCKNSWNQRVELQFCVYLQLDQLRPWNGEAPLHGAKNDVRRKIHLENLWEH